MVLMSSFVSQLTGNKALKAFGPVRDQLIAELSPLFRTYEPDGVDASSAIVSKDWRRRVHCPLGVLTRTIQSP
jgi:hypothetical protein